MTVNIALRTGAETNGIGPFEALEFTGTQENYAEIENFLGIKGYGKPGGIIWSIGYFSMKDGIEESGYNKLYMSAGSELQPVNKGDWIIKCKGHDVSFPINRFVFNMLFTHQEKS
jgi:hypothetical protein